jgi:hypothetical protein
MLCYVYILSDGCHSVKYCSATCSRKDWAVHKLVCKSMRETRDKAVAVWQARGGQQGGSFNQQSRDVFSWYDGVPGLDNEVMLLAWKHRSESPVVVVTTSPIFDAEGAATQVSVMPRSSWDEDPRFLDAFSEDTRENIRMVFSGANCSPDTHYVVVVDIKHFVPQGNVSTTMTYAKSALRGVELVDALTSAATTPEDLAAAIAWCKDSQLSTNNPIMDHLERQAAAHGPPRALHDQVAY